jgi:hypothetical protein
MAILADMPERLSGGYPPDVRNYALAVSKYAPYYRKKKTNAPAKPIRQRPRQPTAGSAKRAGSEQPEQTATALAAASPKGKRPRPATLPAPEPTASEQAQAAGRKRRRDAAQAKVDQAAAEETEAAAAVEHQRVQLEARRALRADINRRVLGKRATGWPAKIADGAPSGNFSRKVPALIVGHYWLRLVKGGLRSTAELVLAVTEDTATRGIGKHGGLIPAAAFTAPSDYTRAVIAVYLAKLPGSPACLGDLPRPEVPTCPDTDNEQREGDDSDEDNTYK